MTVEAVREDVEPSWRVEHRYRAVLDALAGESVTAVAAKYGASRQSIYAWLERYRDEGLVGLQDRSRRPVSSPQRISAELETLICELRRASPRWGAQRIVHELGRRQMAAVPSRSSVYRALVRNDLVIPQEQHHKRKYKRWERDAPMQLWQMDIMSGVFLVGGRECKLVTGIDDHSRFVVVAKVVARPTGRAVCDALAEAIERYGVPAELLTDNGKQFTGRFTKPLPAEVLFERFCRDNGITHLLTRRRSPTTTGKIERWHQTLRHELLDEVGEFADQDAAQAAIDAWVQVYNTQRPHQALGMRTPGQRFRPTPPTALDRLQDRRSTTVDESAGTPQPASPPPSRAVVAVPAPAQPVGEPAPFELDMLVPANGTLSLVGMQQVWLGPALSARTVTLWVDRHSIHVSLDGACIKTVPTRLSVAQLSTLAGRGSRPAGPAPAPPALPTGRRRLSATTVVDVDRTVTRDGTVQLAGTTVNVGAELAGQRVTLRLDGHLMRVIAAGQLARTMPAPVPPDERDLLTGARRAADPTPPPASAIRVQRNVPTDGVVMVARQRLRVGRAHAGKTVTVVLEDTYLRVLHNDTELSVHPRNGTAAVTSFKAQDRTKN